MQKPKYFSRNQKIWLPYHVYAKEKKEEGKKRKKRGGKRKEFRIF
jgi:hypothetical protein